MFSRPSLIPPLFTITTISLEALSGSNTTASAASFSSGAWPASNRALYIPFVATAPLVVTQLFVVNGTTASNNFDIGIYNEAYNLIISTGSTAQSGTSTIQTVNIADTFLDQGGYFLALAFNGTTGTTFRAQVQTYIERAVGLTEQGSAFPLPSTATPANVSSNYIPLFGALLAPRTVI